jgi:hypothetical protein
MAIARVEEIRATSTVSFGDAIRQGVARAHKTLRHVLGGGRRNGSYASRPTRSSNIG